jgi:uncharacterized membrane protein
VDGRDEPDHDERKIVSHRAILRIVLAAFFAGGAVLHFRATDALMSITPSWVPYPREVVLATGVLELLGAAMLVFPKTRKAAGIMLALYVIAVWPANFKHAFEGIVLPPVPDSWWYHALRLTFQPVIAWLCLYAARVMEWPLHKS